MWEIEGVRALCEVMDCYSRRTSPAALSSRKPMKRGWRSIPAEVHFGESGADQSSAPGRVGALGKLRSRQGTTPRHLFHKRRCCPQSCQHKLLISNNLRNRLLAVGGKGAVG